MEKNPRVYALGHNFFCKHQRILLGALNMPVFGKFFRNLIGIEKLSEGRERRLARIEPGSIFWVDKRLSTGYVQMKAEFLTTPYYGKRLYYGLFPVWWAMHFWDWLLADRFLPALSFGFSTLTANPAAGTAGTTFDGDDFNHTNGPTYASCHNNAFDSSRDASSATFVVCANSYLGAGPQFSIDRGCFWFDTSAIGATSIISAAVFSIFGAGTTNNADTDSVSIVGFTGTVVGFNGDQRDFSRFDSTKFATDMLFSAWSTSAYNDFTLNASGIANISKTSISKFGVRTAKDLSTTQPGGQNDVTGTYADNGSNKPKLVVTYALPFFSNFFRLVK